MGERREEEETGGPGTGERGRGGRGPSHGKGGWLHPTLRLGRRGHRRLCPSVSPKPGLPGPVGTRSSPGEGEQPPGRGWRHLSSAPGPLEAFDT